MSQIKIVTDSTVALSKEEINKYGIVVVPLTVEIDGVVYEDGVTINSEEFLEKMENAQHLPKTSQPSIGKFQEVYEEMYDQDPDCTIISIHVSTGLSGTIYAADQAAALTRAKVVTFDSRSADRGQAFPVLEAAKMAQEGKSVDEILERIEIVRDETEVYLSFVSLDNMVAGGRLSKTAGLIGNMLNIKVGAHVDKDGKVEVVAKGRGLKALKKFHDSVLEKMAQLSEIKGIGISHAGVPEVAEKMANKLRNLYPNVEILVQDTTPIVSTHTGKGAMAIIYYGK